MTSYFQASNNPAAKAQKVTALFFAAYLAEISHHETVLTKTRQFIQNVTDQMLCVTFMDNELGGGISWTALGRQVMEVLEDKVEAAAGAPPPAPRALDEARPTNKTSRPRP